jgi:hypothetical protein
MGRYLQSNIQLALYFDHFVKCLMTINILFLIYRLIRHLFMGTVWKRDGKYFWVHLQCDHETYSRVAKSS